MVTSEIPTAGMTSNASSRSLRCIMVKCGCDKFVPKKTFTSMSSGATGADSDTTEMNGKCDSCGHGRLAHDWMTEAQAAEFVEEAEANPELVLCQSCSCSHFQPPKESLMFKSFGARASVCQCKHSECEHRRATKRDQENKRVQQVSSGLPCTLDGCSCSGYTPDASAKSSAFPRLCAECGHGPKSHRELSALEQSACDLVEAKKNSACQCRRHVSEPSTNVQYAVVGKKQNQVKQQFSVVLSPKQRDQLQNTVDECTTSCGCPGFVPLHLSKIWELLLGRTEADAEDFLQALECQRCKHSLSDHRNLTAEEQRNMYIRRLASPRSCGFQTVGASCVSEPSLQLFSEGTFLTLPSERNVLLFKNSVGDIEHNYSRASEFVSSLKLSEDSVQHLPYPESVGEVHCICSVPNGCILGTSNGAIYQYNPLVDNDSEAWLTLRLADEGTELPTKDVPNDQSWYNDLSSGVTFISAEYNLSKSKSTKIAVVAGFMNGVSGKSRVEVCWLNKKHLKSSENPTWAFYRLPECEERVTMSAGKNNVLAIGTSSSRLLLFLTAPDNPSKLSLIQEVSTTIGSVRCGCWNWKAPTAQLAIGGDDNNIWVIDVKLKSNDSANGQSKSASQGVQSIAKFLKREQSATDFIPKIKSKWQAHDSFVSGVDYNLHGSVLVSAGLDARICVWSVIDLQWHTKPDLLYDFQISGKHIAIENLFLTLDFDRLKSSSLNSFEDTGSILALVQTPKNRAILAYRLPLYVVEQCDKRFKGLAESLKLDMTYEPLESKRKQVTLQKSTNVLKRSPPNKKTSTEPVVPESTSNSRPPVQAAAEINEVKKDKATDQSNDDPKKQKDNSKKERGKRKRILDSDTEWDDSDNDPNQTVKKRSGSVEPHKVQKESKRNFEVGDIVWARLGASYDLPLWPAKVLELPKALTRTRQKGKPKVLCYGDNTQDVAMEIIFPYTCERYDELVAAGMDVYDKVQGAHTFPTAVAEAAQILGLRVPTPPPSQILEPQEGNSGSQSFMANFLKRAA